MLKETIHSTIRVTHAKLMIEVLDMSPLTGAKMSCFPKKYNFVAMDHRGCFGAVNVGKR